MIKHNCEGCNCKEDTKTKENTIFIDDIKYGFICLEHIIPDARKKCPCINCLIKSCCQKQCDKFKRFYHRTEEYYNYREKKTRMVPF